MAQQFYIRNCVILTSEASPIDNLGGLLLQENQQTTVALGSVTTEAFINTYPIF